MPSPQSILSAGLTLARRRPGRHSPAVAGGSGVAATALMSLSFLARPRHAPPPKVVAFNVARAVGLDPDELPRPGQTAYWTAAHLGFGVTLATARTLVPGPRSGAGFGLGAWVALYGVALPLLRLYPRVDRDDPVRAVAGLAAHLVFGSAVDRARAAR